MEGEISNRRNGIWDADFDEFIGLEGLFPDAGQGCIRQLEEPDLIISKGAFAQMRETHREDDSGKLILLEGTGRNALERASKAHSLELVGREGGFLDMSNGSWEADRSQLLISKGAWSDFFDGLSCDLGWNDNFCATVWCSFSIVRDGASIKAETTRWGAWGNEFDVGIRVDPY